MKKKVLAQKKTITEDSVENETTSKGRNYGKQHISEYIIEKWIQKNCK